LANNKESNELLKLLGIGFGVAVTIGGTIGTGILRKPGAIAEYLGDPWLIMGVWLAVGLYALLGVLCAIELSVSLPKAGAWYVYAKRAFGPFVGFFTGMTSWLGTVSAVSFGAYTWSEYVAVLFPAANQSLQFIATIILLLLLGLHLLGTRIGGRSQEVISLIKAIGLLIFVIFCFVYGSETRESSQLTHLAKDGLLTGLLGAFLAVFYTFDGWHTATYFSEENSNPTKNLPKSMILGVISILVIYLLVNAAILYVLPMDQLVGSKLAAADAVELMFGPQAGKFLTIFLMISIFGILNAQIMFAPRVIFSMSRDGLFWKKLTTVSKLGTPVFALMTTVFLSIALLVGGKDLSGKLSDVATFFFILSYSLGFASLIQLRKSEPDLARPFKVPFYPFLPYFLLIISILFLVGTVVGDLESSSFALVFIVVSYPLFLIVKKQNQEHS
jgi:basic amino acid/polyamine antiporter, APA family